jgi:hypothetical protein
MTQDGQKEVVALIMALVTFGRAIYPAPIINQSSKKPYESQLSMRIGLICVSIFFLTLWFDFYREGAIPH